MTPTKSTETFGSYPGPMTTKVGLLLSAWLIAACAGHHGSELGPWKTRVPLGPSLHFAEAIAPRTLAVLVVDGHSGAPIHNSPVYVVSERVGGSTDSAGALRLRLPRAAQFVVRVRCIGYEPWQGSAAVTDTTGFALVVQLKRSYQRIVPVVIPENERRPPK